MQTQKAALGDAFSLDDSYRPIWACVPHFVHTPFYVYAYAFGDCLVNALWQRYQNSADSDKGTFIANYRGLLAAGGTVRYDRAIECFGLNVRESDFWHLGLDMIAGMIDQLEALS